MWSNWSTKEKKSNWREPELSMPSLSVWRRVNNNVPSFCRQVSERVNVDYSYIFVFLCICSFGENLQNLNEELLCTRFTFNFVTSKLLFVVCCIVFFRFSAGDESDANQTTTNSISQGTQWKHEQSLTGLRSDFFFFFFCSRIEPHLKCFTGETAA